MKETAFNQGSDARTKILQPVGKKVTFRYPGNEGTAAGMLKSRCVVPSVQAVGRVHYWDVVDLIKFDGKKDEDWIRIGYYREVEGKLRWGSQTTITEPIYIWKRLLVTAAREQVWFRQLLDDVMTELGDSEEQSR